MAKLAIRLGVWGLGLALLGLAVAGTAPAGVGVAGVGLMAVYWLAEVRTLRGGPVSTSGGPDGVVHTDGQDADGFGGGAGGGDGGGGGA